MLRTTKSRRLLLAGLGSKSTITYGRARSFASRLDSRNWPSATPAATIATANVASIPTAEMAAHPTAPVPQNRSDATTNSNERTSTGLPEVMVPSPGVHGTVAFMATNLRLSDDLAGALRKEASRRGKSQQDIVREAIAKELGMASESTPMDRAVRAGTVEAPEPFRDSEPTLTLPHGTNSLDLLDREDR